MAISIRDIRHLPPTDRVLSRNWRKSFMLVVKRWPRQYNHGKNYQLQKLSCEKIDLSGNLYI